MKKASTIKLLPLVATLILCTNVLPGRAGIHYIRHFDYSKPTSDQNHYVPLPMISKILIR